jgi:hypothetical protein
MKELKIEVPQGYEIDKEKSTFEKIIFKKIKVELPKTWDEFCKQIPVTKDECYIAGDSAIINYNAICHSSNRMLDNDRNLLPTKEDAEAHLALIQLHRLRDVYRQGWTRYPDGHCYTIIVERDTLYVSDCYQQRFLSFQSLEIAEEFLKNFRALIETAKDLI